MLVFLLTRLTEESEIPGSIPSSIPGLWLHIQKNIQKGPRLCIS